MLFVVIAAATLAFGPAPSGAGVPKAAPLREIVYRYSFDRRSERTFEDFGTPPESKTVAATYAGTMTVDVTQVGEDGSIRVTATDATDALNGKKPWVADVIVRPGGALVVHGGTADEDMVLLLPYLATNYFGDHQLQEGAEWKSIANGDKMQLTTSYSVSNVTTDSATISAVSQAQGEGVSGPVTTETKLIYKAALLVPMSLDVVTVQTGSSNTSGASTDRQQTHYHFDRVSDTRDTAGAGP